MTARQMMMCPEEFEAGGAVFTDNWQAGHDIHFEDSGHFIPFDQFERFIDIVKSTISS